MSSDLTGKVALVTGASGGIGTALVEALVERGATRARRCRRGRRMSGITLIS
jgi:NAD(P)-dependent dehydrogenase (short-subunit alcohol dehydrogenase family)